MEYVIKNLEIIRACVNENFVRLKRNKKQEIIRLLYEIAKKEKCSPEEIIRLVPLDARRFSDLKQQLVKRRYPNLEEKEIDSALSLPGLNIIREYRVDVEKKHEEIPQNFFIEEFVSRTPFVKKLKLKFPSSSFNVISSFRNYIKGKPHSVIDYNNRLNNFFIIKEEFNFFMRCPCSKESVCCGYHIFNLGAGCAFECVYCYLQAYVNSPGIIFPANIEDFFRHFKEYYDATHLVTMRLGSGQFTDSLVFDHITECSPLIIEFFRKHPRAIFEFKTKSDNIKLLMATSPSENIVVSWSLNPQKIIRSTEFFTAPLKKRLASAVKCVKAGYRVGFHFDPIMHYSGWEKDYSGLVEQLFEAIDEKRVAWISLGCMRMTVKLKQIIENRFPEASMLDEEFFLGYDNKLRYNFHLRSMIYAKMKSWIRKRSRHVPVYLCMEEKGMYDICKILPLMW